MATPWHKYPYWPCLGSYEISKTMPAHFYTCSFIHGLSPRPDTRTPTPRGHEITVMERSSLFINITLLSYFLSLLVFSSIVEEEIIKGWFVSVLRHLN